MTPQGRSFDPDRVASEDPPHAPVPADEPRVGASSPPAIRDAEPARTRGLSSPRATEDVPLEHSRAAATWTGLVIGLLVAILLLVFIVQNLEKATMEFLGWNFTLPLGISLLLAAIAGALVMALVGGIRILQVKRSAKRLRRES